MDGEKQLISFLLMDTAFKENIFDIVSPEMLTEEKVLAEPKNIKQVGMPGEFKKIFVEDFVHTYLWQCSRQKEEKNILGRTYVERTLNVKND